MTHFLIILPVITLIVLFAMRVPIGHAMLATCILFFLAAGKNTGIVLNVAMSNLYSTTSFVAIPLFIFAGNVMNSAKVTEYMFTFAKALIGKRRGATAYINILLSLIFAGMTGSALADACGIGVIEMEEMKRDEYDPEFSAAITAATSTVGPIFPPSIGAVIYSMLAGVSVGKLFAGGMIPAVLMCLSLGVYVCYISRKRNYAHGVSFTFREFLGYTWKALPALITPVLLLGGLYSGVVTCTEAGALAGFYVILISFLIYKSLTWKDLIRIIRESTIQTGCTMTIAMAAWVLSNVVTTTGMDDYICNWFLSVTDNKYVFLLLVNIVFLLLGMFFDSSVIQFVFLPLVIPIASALGVNLIHFGVLTLLNIVIGLISPPYGIVTINVCALSHQNLTAVFKEQMPMLIILLLVLAIVTYVPAIVMFIPNMM